MSEDRETPPNPSAAADDMGSVIDRWFNDKFPGSLVARDTDTWNFVRQAVEELKERLKSRG